MVKLWDIAASGALSGEAREDQKRIAEGAVGTGPGGGTGQSGPTSGPSGGVGCEETSGTLSRWWVGTSLLRTSIAGAQTTPTSKQLLTVACFSSLSRAWWSTAASTSTAPQGTVTEPRHSNLPSGLTVLETLRARCTALTNHNRSTSDLPALRSSTTSRNLSMMGASPMDCVCKAVRTHSTTSSESASTRIC